MESREHLWAEAMRAERRGDSAAYQALLGDIARFLRKLARHRLGQLGLNPHEAEDLVQDVLIALHTKRHTWNQDRPFMPWLFAVTRYKFIDSARRLRREQSRRIDLSYEEMAETIEAPQADPDLAGDIERHLASLPEAQQAVVRSLTLEGASVRETAQRLSASEGAVRVSFHRALQRLRLLAKQKDQG